VRYGRKEEEWVALHEPNGAKAKGSSIQLLETESEERKLRNEIKVTQTILQSVTYPAREEGQHRSHKG
jgi:hypothetical protein